MVKNNANKIKKLTNYVSRLEADIDPSYMILMTICLKL